MVKNILVIKDLDVDKFFQNHSKNKWLILNIREFIKNYRNIIRDKYQKVVIGYYDIKDKSLRYFIEFLLIFISAKKKYFIDDQDNIEQFSFLKFLFIKTPLFIGELIFDLLLVVSSWLWLFIFNLLPKCKKLIHFFRSSCTTTEKKIVYLRTNKFRGQQEGGSFTHFRGTVKGFYQLGYRVYFIGSGEIKIERMNFQKTVIPYPQKFNFIEIPEIYYNWHFIFKVFKIIKQEKPLFIYQRLSVFNVCGAILSQMTSVPLILEYNSPGCWIRQRWGGLLILKRLCCFMENFSLKKATLITAVSKPLKEGLLKRGISARKILVNYNGVDSENFNPNIDGSRIRERYKLGNKIVIGAVSTFGVWHGMPILAEAVGKIVSRIQNTKYQIHFLFIGDGVERLQCERIIRETKMEKYVTFTGIVSFRKIPQYLAACDILVSPHVPNPDGTPFFGSPTKLFEYMATGKGIVASDLGQIGEILEHKKTAWLVKPGDVNDLANGIIKLIEDRDLREKLGKNAREVVVKNYTWEQNAKRTINFYNKKNFS